MTRRRLWIAFLFLFVCRIRAQSTAAPEYREIKCRVVDEYRQPVPNLSVELFGRQRDALYAISELDYVTDPKKTDKYRGWKFQTDKNGLFTVRLGKFAQVEHKDTTGFVEPGYGDFYLITERKDYAGGVSPELLNLNDEDLKTYQERKAVGCECAQDADFTEWEESDFAPLLLTDNNNSDDPMEIELEPGIEVVGQILDTEGRAVAQEELTLFNDLGADSHTGHGGAIFSQGATTDRHGLFRFEHVYPNTFYLELLNHSAGPPYWIKTRVRKRWVDKIEDRIIPRYDEWDSNKDEKSIPILIVVSREPIYRYFGHVTNSQGQPVAGAKVEVRCSLHNPERTYEDDHDYNWQVKTDRNGRYSVRVGSRFVNAIWVYARGYRDDDSGVQEEIFAPGEYDFVLKRK